MKEDAKKKWVEALRSGKYQQGTSCLKNGNEFCCLGVLTDIYHKETGIGEWDRIARFKSPNEKESSILPNEVRDWAELESCDPNVKKGALSSLNDAGTSFELLANYIEAEL